MKSGATLLVSGILWCVGAAGADTYQLRFSQVVGGWGGGGFDIAMDREGYIYIAGTTKDPRFPVTPGAYQTTIRGDADAFVSKYSPEGKLVYSTFLGGAKREHHVGLTVDDQGCVYVAGGTHSADFPVTPGAYDTTFNGEKEWGGDVFVAKLDPAGATLLFSTFLGGSAQETAASVRLDRQGAIVVAGTTLSPDFPHTSGAFRGFDGFVAKLTPDGGRLVFSTLFGGSGFENVTSLSLDGGDNIYIGGNTNSRDFPVTPDALQRAFGGGQGEWEGDTYLTKFDPDGKRLLYSTYLGGKGDDFPGSTVVGPDGRIYLTGSTISPDFPLTSGQPIAKRAAFVTVLEGAPLRLAYSGLLGEGSGRSVVPTGEAKLVAGGEIGGRMSISVVAWQSGRVLSSTTFGGEASFMTMTARENDAAVLGVVEPDSLLLAKLGPSLFASNGQDLGEGESWHVALADVNGDRRLDAYFEGAAWLNDGQGRFHRGSLSLCSNKEAPVYFADLNGDGAVDAVCENKIYLNDGAFHFQQKGALPTDIPMLAAALADLNGDGRVDLIVAGQSEDRVLLNAGGGNFRDTGKGLGGWAQCTYAVGDVNGDGFADVYAGIPHTPPPNMGPANDKLWLGDGKGGFAEARLNIRTNATRGVALADFNGDDHPDLFIASQTGPSKLFFNDGKGGFVDSGQSLGEAPGGKVLAADFNGDGFQDVFVARGGPLDNGVPNLIWLNDGRGRFTDSGLRLGRSNSIDAAVGDLDGDGRPDILVANIKNVMTKKGSGFNEVWLNRVGSLEVTYIANEGFLLASGGKKVLIDALMTPNSFGYDSPSSELLAQMEAGAAPFDGVGAVLATHPHTDHFTATSVAGFLTKNSGSVFLSTRDAVEQVRKIDSVLENRTRNVLPERLRESRREVVGGIEIEALRFSHGRPAYENLAYLIRLNGFTVLHTGDCMDPEDYQAYPWDAAGVDVAIVNRGLFGERSRERFMDAMKNRVRARTVVLMHYALKASLAETQQMAAGLRPHFERVIVFAAPMERVALVDQGAGRRP